MSAPQASPVEAVYATSAGAVTSGSRVALGRSSTLEDLPLYKESFPRSWQELKDILWRSPHIPDALLGFIVFQIVFADQELDIQWQWMGIYGLLLLLIARYARTPLAFFKGGIKDTAQDRSSFWLLTGSAFISWIFAKSIQNASKLGARYGWMGGLAYATYYTSFASAAIVIYFMRKNHGYTSLPEAINHRYGPVATISFSFAVTYRLYQEIWSNSTVVAGFYGDFNDAEWWMAAIVSTFIPFAYVSLGGLRSSLTSDAIQAVLAVVLLVVLLSVIAHRVDGLQDECDDAGRDDCNALTWQPVEDRKLLSMENGVDLAIIGLMQGMFSYPFFDPVLTDRAFLAEPGTMLRAFILGGTAAAVFIFLFSIVGIYGNMAATLDEDIDPDLQSGVEDGEPADVAEYISTHVFSITNIIFLTTSISTLDSTFASTAKLAAEMSTFAQTLVPQRLSEATETHMALGRFAIRAIALFGTLPLLQDPDELSATTVSGTVVMGLGPPVIALVFLPKEGFYPLSFLSSFWLGATLGFLYQYSNEEPDDIHMNNDRYELGDGSYRKLLWFNVVGTFSCLGAFILFFCLEHFILNKHVDFWKDRQPPALGNPHAMIAVKKEALVEIAMLEQMKDAQKSAD